MIKAVCVRTLAVLCAVCLSCRGEEPAKAPVKAPLERITGALNPAAAPRAFEGGVFAFQPGEVVVFAGPENVVIEQRCGWIETAMAAAGQTLNPRFRHMGWEGDTVYRQNRMENHGTWQDNLAAVDATMVVVWFGQNEVFSPDKTPEDFAAAYGALIDNLKQRTPRIVILSPTPFEKPESATVPDNTPRNSVVQKNVEAARKIAQDRGCLFVDLFTPLSKRSENAPRLTRDGIHFTNDGMRELAGLIANELKMKMPGAEAEPLRLEIVEKNRIWFDCWRCMNWAFAYGDRTAQPFAKGTPQFPAFTEELTRFRPLVSRADERVHAIAAGKEPPATLPPEPAPVPPPAQSPEDEMKNFALYPGMSIGLFADEKLGMVKPVQMRWDERGRLWVLCIPSYPQLQPGQRANDYLLILEDTDGDGKADKVTRFAEGLVMPMGFEFGDGGVYICESTQLTFWRDTDGDGKADTRRVILSGFGTGDTHQMINSLRWAPDGCLWFTQGYHVWSYIETPHGISELNRSGLWRLNSRTLKLDGFFNESTAGLNSWGVTFDEYGQVFHGGGANYCLYYSTPGLIPTLHPLPYKDDLCVSKGKSMEPEFLFTRHLPDDLQGVLMKSTYFTSQVSLYRIADDGAGFKSTNLPDLVASKSNDFRPVESRTGPDGAIYICDWLNPIIGHYQASYRDPRRDRSHGRIWRMTADGRPLVKRPELEKMGAEELLEQLKSPEHWVREQARRLMYGLKKEVIIPAADAWVAKLDSKSVEGGKLLYEVTGVFCAHESPRPALVERLLSSDDFRLRCWGTRLIGYWYPALADPIVLLKRSIDDVHPRVRMETIVAASSVGTPEALKVATLALDKPLDFYVNYALTQCVHYLEPVFQKALVSGELNFGPRVHALTYVLRAAGGQSSIAQIKQLLSLGKVAAEQRDELLAVVVEAGKADDLRFALDQSAGSPRVLDALTVAARTLKKRPTGDLDVDLEKLFLNVNPQVRASAYRLAAALRAQTQTARALAAAQDVKAAAVERAAAAEAYASLAGREAVPALVALGKAAEPELRIAALAALAPLDLDASASRVAELLGDLKKADEFGPLLLPVLTQAAGADALAKSIKEKKPPAAAALLALQWMAKAGHSETPVLEALGAAAGIALDKDRKEYSPELVARLVADAKTIGDAKRGEKLFRMQDYSCLNCHKVGNEGATIGPELTSVARAMTPELTVEAVLWPARQVKEGYLLTRVATRDGRFLQGFIAADTAEVLTLRDPAGPMQTIRKSEIKKRNDAGTLMPDGLTDRMTREELADLLRFLMELGK